MIMTQIFYGDNGYMSHNGVDLQVSNPSGKNLIVDVYEIKEKEVTITPSRLRAMLEHDIIDKYIIDDVIESVFGE